MAGLTVAINAIVPFLFYIVFGWGVRHFGLAGEDFLKQLNQLVFRCFFPIMMFCNVSQIDPGTEIDPKLILMGVGSVLLVIAAAWLVVPRLVSENSRRGVIIMMLFRSNFVLFALPLTISVFGEAQSAIPVMMIAFVIPTYNVMSVIVLEAFRGGRIKAGTLCKNVLTNPMIMGVLVGLAALLVGIKVPSCLMKPLKQFSDLSTPLGMFVLGGTLRFGSLRDDLKYILSVISFKMLLMPVLVMVVTGMLGMAPLERFILLAMYATPVASGSYAMAENMGGDGDLAGECIVVSTVCSVPVLFAWICFLGNTGFLG